MYNDELYHYGVKGMKWGVRRDRATAAAWATAQARDNRARVNEIHGYMKKDPRLKGDKELRSNLRKNSKSAAMFEKLAKVYASGLSAKDLARGQKRIDKIFSGTSVGGFGSKADKANRKASKYIDRANASLDSVPKVFLYRNGKSSHD